MEFTEELLEDVVDADAGHNTALLNAAVQWLGDEAFVTGEENEEEEVIQDYITCKYQEIHIYKEICVSKYLQTHEIKYERLWEKSCNINILS